MAIQLKNRTCSSGGEFHLPYGHKLWFEESRTIDNNDYTFKVYKGKTSIIYVNCWFRDSGKFMLNFALKGFQKDEIINACINSFKQSIENDPGLIEYNQENEKTEIEYRMKNLASLLNNLRAINLALKKQKGLDGLGGIPKGAFRTLRNNVDFRVGYNPIMCFGSNLRAAKQYAIQNNFNTIAAYLSRNEGMYIQYNIKKIGTLSKVMDDLSWMEYDRVCKCVNDKQYIYDKKFDSEEEIGFVNCVSSEYFYKFADGFITILDYAPIH